MTTPSLRSYLDTKYTKSADWNVNGWGAGWGGKYAIPESEYELFLELVADHVFTKGKACGVLERHKAVGPILIDLDFRYAPGGPLQRRFTDEQVREFVAAYANAIAHFFEPPAEPLQFYVMVKPGPEKDKDNIKDGLHIVCPTLVTPPETQFALRGYLLQTGAIERIFGSTGLVCEPQNCLDLAVIKDNSWFLYGACKPDKPWYKVTHIYGVSLPSVMEDEPSAITADYIEEEATDTLTPQELVKVLSIRYQRDQPSDLTLRTDTPLAETEWMQLLHRWGSGKNWAKTAKSPALFAKTAAAPPPLDLGTPTSGGNPVGGGGQNEADEMVQVSGMSVRAGYTMDDIKLAHRIVNECLNPEKRCGNYQDWVNLALCLKNISESEDSLKAWVGITRRLTSSHKKARLSDSELLSKWKSLPTEGSAVQRGRKPLLMGTLTLWAKEDSPAAYRAILNEANKELAYLNDSGTHVAVADLIVRMYRHEFRCTPGRKGATAASMDWYQFPSDAHTWRSLKTSMRLRERLSNEVRNVYIQADVEAAKREMASTDQSEKERLQDKRKKLLKVETQLQSTNFKDSVMKEAAEKFYDEEFLQHMNQDPCLVGFANGVLELRHPGSDGQPHTFFRPGRPDDCVSFQMGRGMLGLDAIPFLEGDLAYKGPGVAGQPAEYAEIEDFFEKIYPDPVLRVYCLTLYSSCLEGANREQKFYILTGLGSNGKSKIVDLLSKTFGEYRETLSTTALTRKRPDSGAANPDTVVLKCKRFVDMSEPDEGEKINTASMKQLSGEDTVKARALFQDQDQFVVMAKIFMLCNDLPPVSSTDGGTWRRLRVIPHVAKFVDPGVPTNPAQHIHTKDLLLDGKIARWRPYVASMLAWYYEHHYLREGLKEPDQVMAASNKYKEENDSFAAFTQECIVKEVAAELRANDAYMRYKEWLKFNAGKKQLKKAEFVQKLTEIYGKPQEGSIFVGIRIAMEGEDGSGNPM